MNRKIYERGLFLGVFVALIIFLFSPIAEAVMFDDISVTVTEDVVEELTHGYREIQVLVNNSSRDKTHEVKLSLPGNSYGYGGDYIAQMSNVAIIGPLMSATITMYQPPLPMHGDGIRVIIDGKLQKGLVGFQNYRNNFGRRIATIKLSHEVSIDDFNKSASEKLDLGGSATSTSGMGGFIRNGKIPIFLQTQIPIQKWSKNWLAYTGYDGIIVTAKEMVDMPQDILKAIEEFVRAGGVLMVLGDYQLQQTWHGEKTNIGTIEMTQLGFGVCCQTQPRDVKNWDENVWKTLKDDVWESSSRQVQNKSSISEANNRLPVVDSLAVPIKGMFILVIVFAILMGPVNLYVLSKLKRRIWMIWTLPTISLVACAAVFLFSFLSEGWQGNTRVCEITILNEETNLATTIALAGYYSPLTPKGGLHFDYESEITPMTVEDWRGGRARMIDWSNGQNFYAGWVTARVPAHYMIRKNQLRRERVKFSDNNGVIQAVNGLGHDIEQLWYADKDGNVFKQFDIPAGAKLELESVVDKTMSTPTQFRGLYKNRWEISADKIKKKPSEFLKPNSYIAILAESVFIEDAMDNVDKSEDESIVFGFLEGDLR